ncbi:hypothetical protein BUALT_Bualt07G0072000 [Buddleja alternifolia]|uniref:DDE Tnp4 domain-containing protein n=1 Tax=Buddleja alternifolia TaxID=168488 RepID=A0AAV6XGM3_9LAMI|nr:hypothetical protein BUALT_Bualt07G0072000 [Buddleja alternifolia]
MDFNEENEHEEFKDLATVALVSVMVGKVVYYYENHMVKEPCRDSIYQGHRFIMDVLNGHFIRRPELFRMEKHVFLRLAKELRQRNLLDDSREVSVEEQSATFLMTIAHNERNRILQERFQHSGETISCRFNTVLKALARFSMSIIVPPSFEEIASYIHNNNKYWPHFKFTFIWAGYGKELLMIIAYLMKLLTSPSLKSPMPPKGKYYVVDAGYPNMSGFLAPYKGVRYHVKQFQRGRRASGPKEFFNHTHSSLRNIIERCFREWKSPWPILKKMASFPFQTQRLIVVASMALHSYIRQEAIADEIFRLYDEDESYFSGTEETEIDLDEDENHNGSYKAMNRQQSEEMDLIRDAIADSICQGS